jgi:hypothetical protein
MRKRLFVILALAVLAAAAGGVKGGSSAEAAPAANGVKGHFSLILMAHTLASVPEFNVGATVPWNGRLQHRAHFSYRSIPCTGNAPVNNISSDLPSYNTRVPGSRTPSSMRAHPFEFDVVRTRVGKGKKARTVWQLRGTITFTVCKLAPGPTTNPDPVPDAQKPKIFMSFRANFSRPTAETVRYSGTVKLIGGTQRYRDLRGSGRIAGYFFCFAAEGCAAKGALQDNQMVIHGTYEDPTPQLETP